MAYGDRVQFFVIYIHEAHALDGRSPLGGGNHPILEQPVSLAERQRPCVGHFRI